MNNQAALTEATEMAVALLDINNKILNFSV